MAASRARATALFLEIPRGAHSVTAIPIAPAWEEPGVHTLTEAVLICMLVKLDSNDNPNFFLPCI